MDSCLVCHIHSTQHQAHIEVLALDKMKEVVCNNVFRSYRQFDSMDCGPTCLRMIAKFYGKNYIRIGIYTRLMKASSFLSL